MVLELQKFSLKRQSFCRSLAIGRSKLAFGMREHLVQVTRHLDWRLPMNGAFATGRAFGGVVGKRSQCWTPRGPSAALGMTGGDASKLDREALHFVVERWPLNPEQLSGFLLIPVTLRERFENRIALHRFEA